MTNPPTGLRTLAWARPLTRVAATALVLLGLAAIIGGELLGWSRFDPAGGHFPPVGVRVGMGVLSVALAAVALVWGGRWRQVAALGAVAVLAFGILQLITITPHQGYGLGGPLTILGAVALAGGWLLGGPPVRPAERTDIQLVPGLIVLLGTALLVGFAGWGAQHWFTEGRFVDSDTSGAPGSTVAAAPDALDHQRWQRVLDGDQLVGLASGVLVIRDDAGVRGLDPATGKERWHYQRSDLSSANAVTTADGKTIVLFYVQGRGVLAVALNAGTGAQRWTRQLNATKTTPWNVGTLVAAGSQAGNKQAGGQQIGAVELGGGHGVRFTGVDGAGAAPEFPAFPAGQACTVSAVAAAGDTVAVAGRCAGTEAVAAVSARTGKTLWTWQPPYPSGFTSADPLLLTGTGTGLLVEYGERAQATTDGVPVAVAVPRSAVLLDPASGKPGPAYRLGGTLLLAQGSTAIYLDGAAVGVDLSTGSPRWSTPLTVVAGYHPVSAGVAGGTGYLVLRGPNNDGRMNGDGGAIGVVALNLDSGQQVASRILVADPTTLPHRYRRAHPLRLPPGTRRGRRRRGLPGRAAGQHARPDRPRLIPAHEQPPAGMVRIPHLYCGSGYLHHPK